MEDPRSKHSAERICIGASMSPTVMPGSLVQVVRAPASQVRSGDVVLFASRSADSDVLHRFVFKVPLMPYFVHRGDAIGAGVGLARCERLIGIAALPRRRTALRDYVSGWRLVLGRAVRWRSRPYSD